MKVKFLPWRLAEISMKFELLPSSTETDELPWKLVELASMEISMKANLLP